MAQDSPHPTAAQTTPAHTQAALEAEFSRALQSGVVDLAPEWMHGHTTVSVLRQQLEQR